MIDFKPCDNIEKYFSLRRPEQCPVGTAWLVEKVRAINPKVYVEIGCAHLDTFGIYESLLPETGIAVGVDLREYAPWDSYKTFSGCRHHLFSGGSANYSVVSNVRKALSGKQVDFLFIDGDHDIEPVNDDWNLYSPMVRQGGLVAVHDVDLSAYYSGHQKGHGGAWLYHKLKGLGFRVELVPESKIGTAVVYV